jgi:hypothetical protein
VLETTKEIYGMGIIYALLRKTKNVFNLQQGFQVPGVLHG